MTCRQESSRRLKKARPKAKQAQRRAAVPERGNAARREAGQRAGEARKVRAAQATRAVRVAQKAAGARWKRRGGEEPASAKQRCMCGSVGMCRGICVQRRIMKWYGRGGARCQRLECLFVESRVRQAAFSSFRRQRSRSEPCNARMAKRRRAGTTACLCYCIWRS